MRMGYDIAHIFGADISVSASGDISLSTGKQLGQQRVIRRLLTNPGAYLWHLGYGAGLPQQIGQTTSARQMQGIINAQMKMEEVVAQLPPPTVTVSSTNTGAVYASVEYADATSGETSLIDIPVTG